MPEGVATPAAATLPPLNADAEESVLGALLLAGGGPLIERIHATGLEPGDFYSQFRGRIYRAALDLHHTGDPYDPVTLGAELERRGHLDDIQDGRRRLHDLVALAPSTGPAANWARIVVEQAKRRRVEKVAERAAATARAGTGTADQVARQLVDDVADIVARSGASQPLDGGMAHQQVLDLDPPPVRYLVDDLIPAGAVGTIAAVPESHKSWLAQAIAIRVGRGAGWILGKQVLAQGRVGYIWQDDSTTEEAERVKAFEHVHPTAHDATTDVTWWLNTGVELPRDINRIRATVEKHGLVLLVLDSYYNFLAGVDLKDDQAEQIVALLKREISDATGCTVLIVDHMPWATEQNRQRLRAYGGVFKNAATRFGIYIDAAGDKLHLEARGNNIKGIPRRLAYWDPDTLELKLVTDDIEREDLVEARRQTVLDWLTERPGSHTMTHVREGVGGKASLTDEALEQLKTEGLAIDHDRRGDPWIGGRGVTHLWSADRDVLRDVLSRKPAPQLEMEERPENVPAETTRDVPEDEEPGRTPGRTARQTQQQSQTSTSPPRDVLEQRTSRASMPSTSREEPLYVKDIEGGRDVLQAPRKEVRPEPRPDDQAALDAAFGGPGLPTDEKKGAS